MQNKELIKRIERKIETLKKEVEYLDYIIKEKSNNIIFVSFYSKEFDYSSVLRPKDDFEIIERKYYKKCFRAIKSLKLKQIDELNNKIFDLESENWTL